MKKQYIKIQTKIVRLNPSELICVSSGIGDDVTDVMHSRQGTLDDFGSIEAIEDNIWD